MIFLPPLEEYEELDCDWHVAAEVLDYMTRTGQAEYQGNSKYLIN